MRSGEDLFGTPGAARGFSAAPSGRRAFAPGHYRSGQQTRNTNHHGEPLRFNPVSRLSPSRQSRNFRLRRDIFHSFPSHATRQVRAVGQFW